jgi:protoporphyrinogen oxidase
MVNKSWVMDHCLIYFSTKDTIFKRVTEFKHFSRKLAPQNLTSLAVEICTDPEDEIWEANDRQIFEPVMVQLERLGIIQKKDILDYFTVKIPSVYPVYFLNYSHELKIILDDLSRIKNLVSIGRRGLYQHDNMPTSIEAGLETARLIERYGQGDLGRINSIVYQDRLNKYQDIL